MKDEQNRIPLLIEKMPRVTYYLPYYPYYLQPDNLRETIKEFKLYLYGGKKTSILYYLHSQTLRDEAVREIKSKLRAANPVVVLVTISWAMTFISGKSFSWMLSLN